MARSAIRAGRSEHLLQVYGVKCADLGKTEHAMNFADPPVLVGM